MAGRYRAKQIYAQEMKHGATIRIIIKVVMVGTAGSGKSTSLETVMDQKPPAEKDRESTPLMKRPVQTEVIHIENKVKWVKKSVEEKKQYIASLLRARAQRLHQSFESTSITDDSTSPSTQTSPTPTSTQSTPVKLSSSSNQSTSSSNQSSTDTQAEAFHTSESATTTTEQSSSGAVEVTVESLLQSSEVDDEFISLIHIPNDDHEIIFTEKCVYIVDSGGQPEFVEAMIVFLRNTSACILVNDLSQSLDHHQLIGYYRKGKPVSKPYRCPRTNEENLKQCMQTMRTFTSKTRGPPPKILLLGTHLDKLRQIVEKNKKMKIYSLVLLSIFVVLLLSLSLLSQALLILFLSTLLLPLLLLVSWFFLFPTSVPSFLVPPVKGIFHYKFVETVEEKNKRIEKIIPLKFKDQIIRCSKQKLIFEINALNPDSTDKMIAERVRRYITEQCKPDKVEIPIRWHAFDQKLRSIADGLGRKVMSRQECWQVAESLGLDEASFNGALEFFHNVSLMFYFHEILPEIVFIDPQVMLDKVSELVEFMFELREQNEPSSETLDVSLLPPDWQRFNTFGQITKQFLEDKRFSEHYHPGIFTCANTIKLLVDLLIFANLSTGEGPDTWFMPSVLKQVSAAKMKEICVSTLPLVIDFEDGGPQSGIFCSLISHLLSHNQHPCPWKLCLCEGEPTYLYRNCIQFVVPNIGLVTLIDRYEYFEVHVSTSEGEMKELWYHVRNAVFDGINTVRETLGYSENEPRTAIVCPSHTNEHHPAYIKNEKWFCTSDDRSSGYLSELNAKLHWHGTNLCNLYASHPRQLIFL